LSVIQANKLFLKLRPRLRTIFLTLISKTSVSHVFSKSMTYLVMILICVLHCYLISTFSLFIRRANARTTTYSEDWTAYDYCETEGKGDKEQDVNCNRLSNKRKLKPVVLYTNDSVAKRCGARRQTRVYLENYNGTRRDRHSSGRSNRKRSVKFNYLSCISTIITSKNVHACS
jgi:hypothetical protein